MTTSLILPAGTDECRQLVWSHARKVGQLATPAIPVERYDGLAGPQIIFQSTPRLQPPTHLFSLWLKSIRVYSLTASVAPTLVVTAWIYESSFPRAPLWNFQEGALASIGVILIQIALNQLNEVRKYLRFFLPDPENTRSLDPSNPASLLSGRNSVSVLHEGWVSPKKLFQWAWVTGVFGLLLGIPALMRFPTQLALLTLAAILGIFLYLGMERRTSPRPGHSRDLKVFRDVLAFILVGPALIAGLSLAYLNYVPQPLLILGLALGTAAAAIVHANNLQDIPDDLSLSSRTLASALGFRLSKSVFGFLYLASLGCIGWGTESLIASLIAGLMILRPLLHLLKTVKNSTGPTSPHLFGLRETAALIHFRLALGIALHYSAVQWPMLLNN